MCVINLANLRTDLRSDDEERRDRMPPRKSASAITIGRLSARLMSRSRSETDTFISISATHPQAASLASFYRRSKIRFRRGPHSRNEFTGFPSSRTRRRESSVARRVQERRRETERRSLRSKRKCWPAIIAVVGFPVCRGRARVRNRRRSINRDLRRNVDANRRHIRNAYAPYVGPPRRGGPRPNCSTENRSFRGKELDSARFVVYGTITGRRARRARRLHHRAKLREITAADSVCAGTTNRRPERSA